MKTIKLFLTPTEWDLIVELLYSRAIEKGDVKANLLREKIASLLRRAA